MAEAQVIDMVDVKDGWLKLMLRFANSTDTVFRCECRNKEEALIARNNLNNTIRNRDTWFNMIVVQRGTDVYVVKVDRAKRVVIRA